MPSIRVWGSLVSLLVLDTRCRQFKSDLPYKVSHGDYKIPCICLGVLAVSGYFSDKEVVLVQLQVEVHSNYNRLVE